MANVDVGGQPVRPTDGRRGAGFALGSSAIEALAGAVTVVLAILGLANVQPHYMLPVSAIALGLALVFQGGAVAARCATASGGNGKCATSAEFMGGVAGIVLGVLALLNIIPMVLISVAAVVYGAAVLLGACTTARMCMVEHSVMETPADAACCEAATASAGAQVLVGLAVVILGILALVGIKPETLVLVAFLVLGAGILMGASAIGGHMAARVHR